ncbi:MAG: type II toxin-antitoxin system toxin DhiT [Chthoniobacterales bacterium]
MPTISFFYGIIIQMFFYDNGQHHSPHIHVLYQDDESVFSIENASIIEGQLPNKQRKMVEAWIEIHKEELMADWKLAISGQEIFKIAPLR